MNEQRMESYGTIRELMLLNIPLNIKNVEKLLCWVNEKCPHSLVCLDTSCTVPGSLVVEFKTMRKWNLAEGSVSQWGDGFEVFYPHLTSCLLFSFSFVCDGNFISNSGFCHVFSNLCCHYWTLTIWNQMQNKLCSLRFFWVLFGFYFVVCFLFVVLVFYHNRKLTEREFHMEEKVQFWRTWPCCVFEYCGRFWHFGLEKPLNAVRRV